MPDDVAIHVRKRRGAWYVTCTQHPAPHSLVAEIAGVPRSWGPYAEPETAQTRASGHIDICHTKGTS